AQADPRVQRDPGTELLECRHQREREQRGPEERVAELASNLRVRADAAGVVVAGTGDETWPEQLQPADGSLASGLLDGHPTRRCAGVRGAASRPAFVLVRLRGRLPGGCSHR